MLVFHKAVSWQLPVAICNRESAVVLRHAHGFGEAHAHLIEEENSSRVREDAEQREMFEIVVRFNNGARIEATFPTRQEAIGFLRTFGKA